MRELRSYGASDLEQEFDLELGDGELSSSYPIDRDSEADFETDEFEDIEGEFFIGESLAERLAELASNEFESEEEYGEALENAFREKEDLFFGKAISKVGRFAKRAAPMLLKGAGLNPAMLKNLLSTDFLRKSLATAAKAAMASNPALAALTPALGTALKSFGLSESEFDESEGEAWQSFEVMAEGAYEHLVRNLSDNAAHPVGAMQLAAKSLKHGAERARSRAGGRRGGSGKGSELRVRADRLRPGDKIIIRVV